MRYLIDFFIKNGLFANLLTIILIGLGIYSVFTIKKEAFPNVAFDYVSVTTTFTGASPEEVEKLITNPIEQEIKEVDGIKKLTSFSIEGRSSISIQMDSDQSSGKQGKSDIQEIIDRITNLPENADEPLVVEIETKRQPVVEIALSGAKNNLELRKIAKKLEDMLENIPGVANVVLGNEREVEVHIEANPNKLKAHSLSLDDLIAALKVQNVSIPGGSIESSKLGEAEKIIRTKGDFNHIKDVKETVIRANDLGEPITIADVAKLSYQLEKATILDKANGRESMRLTVLKKESGDIIDVVNGVKSILRGPFTEKYGKQIKYSLFDDKSYYVKRRLGVLTNNLAIGLLLVLLILALILKPSIAAIVALGIPLSFLGCIFIFSLMGISLNLLTLMGLIIVVGMLVDDAIVVTDNVVRRMEEGEDFNSAAVNGTYEIWWPVTASVFTTIAAFGALVFMTGIFGKFVKNIPYGVIIALLISLFECFFILPYHLSHWISKKALFKESGEIKLGIWEKYAIPMYEPVVKWCVNKRYIVACGATILLLVTSFAAYKMKKILFPPEGVEIFMIKADAPTGSTLRNTSEAIVPIEEALSKLPESELDTYTATIGLQRKDPNDPTTKRGSQYAIIKVFLTPENTRDRTALEIINQLKDDVGEVSALKSLSFERINPGPPVGKPISIGVRGDNYKDILEGTEYLKDYLKNIDGVTDIKDSYTVGKKELNVHIKKAEAASAGLSAAKIGTTVRAAFEGIVATSIKKLDEEINIRVLLPEKYRKQSASLEDLRIPNSRGQLIHLKNVASIVEGQGVSHYEHQNRKRQVKVVAEVDVKKATSVAVNAEIEKLIPDWQRKFPNISFHFGGENEDTVESFQSLMRAAVIAALLVLLLLVLLFKSLIQSFLVLITIPLGFIAVIWTFIFHGYPFTFMGGLGMVALFGVIVNNAIVFIDFINKNRERGLSNNESIIKTALSRARPIFLTTITSVFGILPTAYGIGGLDKFVVPIALALGWGLFIGSILTSLILPASVAIVDDFGILINKCKCKIGMGS